MLSLSKSLIHRVSNILTNYGFHSLDHDDEKAEVKEAAAVEQQSKHKEVEKSKSSGNVSS